MGNGINFAQNNDSSTINMAQLDNINNHFDKVQNEKLNRKSSFKISERAQVPKQKSYDFWADEQSFIPNREPEVSSPSFHSK